ncbi:hypothetical protein D9613_012710 [Agrocybe pediades]|uniref:Uncharacterized protein n=1 Tax=Agrocybe pediades TaxID=84607 RepID=A0A8H4QKG7_9AGAR|nr:hypothetical protein D9613_012710 [Agrocybe pediades]
MSAAFIPDQDGLPSQLIAQCTKELRTLHEPINRVAQDLCRHQMLLNGEHCWKWCFLGGVPKSSAFAMTHKTFIHFIISNSFIPYLFLLTGVNFLPDQPSRPASTQRGMLPVPDDANGLPWTMAKWAHMEVVCGASGVDGKGVGLGDVSDASPTTSSRPQPSDLKLNPQTCRGR